MLRQSVRTLEVLLEQQSPAMLLRWCGTTAAVRNSATQASKQLVRRPVARNLSTQSTIRPIPNFRLSSPSLPSRTQPRRTLHSSRPRRSQEGSRSGGPNAAGETGKAGGSSSSSYGSGGTAAEESMSLKQRIKKLSREYGWTAVGVYFGLSLLDFPFCFLLVRTLGTDRIGKSSFIH